MKVRCGLCVDAKFAQHLKTFLFTEGPITEIEAEMVHGQGGGETGGSSDAGAAASDGSLGIGSLRSAKPAGKAEGAK